jgi:hypothetical protein
MPNYTDHTMALNDIERTWQDGNGLYHALCSCGYEMTAMSIEGISRQFVTHTKQQEGG